MEFKTIRESVAYATGIDEGLIRSLKKKRSNGSVVMGTQIMTAKQIAVGLAKKHYPDYTWEEIGWIIGTNDHASVIHHHNKFLAFMETDTDFIKAVFFSKLVLTTNLLFLSLFGYSFFMKFIILVLYSTFAIGVSFTVLNASLLEVWNFLVLQGGRM